MLCAVLWNLQCEVTEIHRILGYAVYLIAEYYGIPSVRVESFSSIQEIVSGYRVLGLLHAYDGVSLTPMMVYPLSFSSFTALTVLSE